MYASLKEGKGVRGDAQKRERRGEERDILLLGPDGVHALGKVLGLLEVGQLALHPDGVGVGGVGDGAVDGAITASLEAVVALAGARGLPVEEDVAAEDAAGDGAGLGVGEDLALHGGAVLVGEALGVGARGDGLEDGVVEALEPGLGHPLVLDGLQRVARLAGLLGGHHQVVERRQAGVGAAHDEGVVAGVDGGGDERGGLGVGAGDGDEVGACRVQS